MKNITNKSTKKKPIYFEIDEFDNQVQSSDILIEEQFKPKLTPMKQQYAQIKQHYPNDLVLFQRGDFYQAYLDDAIFVKNVIGCNWKERDLLIGIHEANINNSIYQLVMKNRKVVLCQQVNDASNSQDNALISRQITGIYSRGLLGFGLLNQEIEENYLVSLKDDIALVIETITKRGYYTNIENIAQLNISELITNDQYKSQAFKSASRGKNVFEQLQNYFIERKIDGISQISLFDFAYNIIDNLRNKNQNICYLNNSTFDQLFFKSLFQAQSKEGNLRIKEMLKRTNLDNIADRQLAIKELSDIQIYRDNFLDQLKQFPNLRGNLARIYNKSNNPIALKEYLENLLKIVRSLKQRIYIHQFKSEILNSLNHFSEDVILQEQNQIIWEGQNYEIPTPAEQNMRQSYLEITELIESVNEQGFSLFLEIKKNIFQNNPNVNYLNFQIEIPEDLECKGFLFISKRKGFKRYQSRKLCDLEQLQNRLHGQLNSFIEKFYYSRIDNLIKLKDYFNKLFDQISILDALMAFSKYLEKEDHCCFADIIEEQQIKLVQFRHPLIKDCVMNDLEIRKGIILTGYNGAGKSTILRSVGLLVILSQVGCRVPCKMMQFRPVNYIYSRVGASDSILRSTFYQELFEVKQMLHKDNSLLLIDELGRGTSSIDGHSLAYAILKYLIGENNIILFTTHFDIRLLDLYQMEDYQLKRGQNIVNLTNKYFNKE